MPAGIWYNKTGSRGKVNLRHIVVDSIALKKEGETAVFGSEDDLFLDVLFGSAIWTIESQEL